MTEPNMTSDVSKDEVFHWLNESYEELREWSNSPLAHLIPEGLVVEFDIRIEQARELLTEWRLTYGGGE